MSIRWISLFNWAKFRKTKAGIKLHVKLNHSGYLPEIVKITNAETHENKYAYNYNIEEGDVVAFDRGFNDYEYYASHCITKSYFVTRLRKNAKYIVLEERDVSKHKYIKSDKIIMFTGYYSKLKKKDYVRYPNEVKFDSERIEALLDNKSILHLLKELPSENKLGTKETKVTALSEDFYKIINTFEWEEDDLVDFIREMISLTPEERKSVYNEMLNKSEQQKKDRLDDTKRLYT